MLKNLGLRKLAVSMVSLFLIGIIYLMPSKDNVSISESVNYIDPENLRTVYLLDNNNYLAEVSAFISSNQVEEEIKEKLEIMTIGIKDDKKHKDFKGILPLNTKINSVTVKDGECTVDFSKELLDVKKEDEEHLIEAIVFAITSTDKIDKVRITVENESLIKLPSGKKIPEILDRSYGINKIYDINSISNLTKTTIYFSSNASGLNYYVPVTKVSNNNEEKVLVIVSELKSSILYQSNLTSYLNSKAKLKKYEKEEEVMKLTFDDKIFESIYDKNILEEVVYSVGKSIKENYDVNEVMFYVEDELITKF